MSDNIEVTVQHNTKEAFEMAMRLIFLDNFRYEKGSHEKKFSCNGYQIENNQLFLSKYSEKCTKFAYEYNIQQTIDFAWGWWENNQKPSEEEPDTDGSTKVAFLITTENCGVGSSDWGMFVLIKPIWFVYGK